MIKVTDQTVLDDDFRHDKDDLIRIQRALFLFRGIIVTLDEAALIWSGYSDHLAASWLFLPNEDESIPEYIESSDYFTSYEDLIK